MNSDLNTLGATDGLNTLPVPQVSVIVPMHNSCSTIGCCLEGLAAQTFMDFEAILIDDGSTDGTADYVRELIRDDKRFRVFEKEAGGVSSARNLGLEHARGEWVTFADSDDWQASDAFELLMDAVSGGAQMAIGDFCRVRGSLCSYKAQGEAGTVSFAEFIKRMMKRPANFYYGSLWNKLFKRSIIEENNLRFMTGFDYGEDHLLILQYLMHVDSVGVVDKPVYYYVDTPGSLMHQGMNLPDIAKNKLRLVGAYASLCKRAGITRNPLGAARVPGFLFTPSTDGMVLKYREALDPDVVPSGSMTYDNRWVSLDKRDQ